ncbi:MAG: 5-methyltetrahydropteroyltriglutamate--homocysteine methyltransferase, partial [Finegoldia magna]|nr:5-methyltetrahydropteroyltriglutamate--homocysteine methyltransferase [Finegoldia magna]
MSLHVPFRYDYVGSFLRDEKLLKARSDFEKEIITKQELKEIEDECIKKLIKKQKELGYHVITDGEFRRKSWHLDFFWGLNGIKRVELSHGYYFHGKETYHTSVQVEGKITGENHPFVEH